MYSSIDSFLRQVDEKDEPRRIAESIACDDESAVSWDLEDIHLISSGRNDIRCGRNVFSTFISINRDYDDLYVILNGARTRKYPEFKRWSWYDMIRGSMINIADPMYVVPDELKIGWYWGRDPSDPFELKRQIVEIIEKVKGHLGSKRVIFYSSSAGCSTAVECANMLGDSTVVCINPQLDISMHPYYPEFKRLMAVDESDPDSRAKIDVVPLIGNRTNRYIIIQNRAGPADMKQCMKLCNAYDIEPKMGLTVKDNIALWIYEGHGDNPHNVQENRTIFKAIERVIDSDFSDASDLELLVDFVDRYWLLSTDAAVAVKNDEDIAVYPNGIETVDLRLGSDRKPYSHLVLSKGLKNDREYILTAEEFDAPGYDRCTITVKDTREGKNLFRKTVTLDCFPTIRYKPRPDRELCLYPGNPGETTSDFGVRLCCRFRSSPAFRAPSSPCRIPAPRTS
ncbi:MAG: hypothetical protein E7Z68_10440 [Thermoplasmata archaeon]|nr:hypothetical protein [Thermoplasmata archaeon]